MPDDRDQGDAPVRVLLIDDHPITRDGVRCGLERAGGGVVVAEAATARAGCLLADEVCPDVVLVDLRLTDPWSGEQSGHGIEVIRYLRERWPAVRILVLSQADPDDVLEAIRAGAHGCVSKAATSAELAWAVRAVRSGPVIPPELAAHIIGDLHRRSGQPAITPREWDVLRCLAKGYDNREIAEELGIAVRTVNRHLENIRAKLGQHRRSELIRYAKRSAPDRSSTRG